MRDDMGYSYSYRGYIISFEKNNWYVFKFNKVTGEYDEKGHYPTDREAETYIDLEIEDIEDKYDVKSVKPKISIRDLQKKTGMILNQHLGLGQNVYVDYSGLSHKEVKRRLSKYNKDNSTRISTEYDTYRGASLIYIN